MGAVEASGLRNDMSLERLSLTKAESASTIFLYQLNSKIEVCLYVPANVNSAGLWRQYDDVRWWLNNSLPLLELQLVLFFFLVTTFHFLFKRLGVPKLSIQIITGLIFGYSWNQWEEQKQKLFPLQSEEILGMLAYFGYMLFLFISAVKMDVRMIKRTGSKALIIGIPTLLVPFICGYFVATRFLDELIYAQKIRLPLIVSTYSMISFPVVASLLSELKIMSSELGRLGLSTALIGELLSQLILTIGNQIRVHKKSARKGYLSTGGLILEFLLVGFVFRPAVLWIIKNTPEGKPVSRSRIQGVLFIVLLSSVVSTLISQPAIFGPYVLGLAIPDGGPFAASLIEKLEFSVYEMFLPIFVVTCCLHVDLSKLSIAFGVAFTKFHILIVLVTFVAKVLCCFLCSMYCKLPVKHSLALSLILSCKGVVELAFFTLFMEFKHISDGILGWLIVMVLIIATLTTMAVKRLYDPTREFSGCNRKNRNIMNLSTNNSELRVVVCVHKNEQIFGLLHLLNLPCPTPQNPLAIYVLHLIELVGRTTPIFISHRLEHEHNPKPKPNPNPFPFNTPHHQNTLLLSFNYFEKHNDNSAVFIDCFTTITPHKFMQNDICKLALDKLSSLIILPFHRKWTLHGLIDQDDHSIRTLNCSVIDRAPCSVGIFADRGHLGTRMASTAAPCKYSVCVIYLGGCDDREAISYARRLAKDSRVELTVVRLVLGSDLEVGTASTTGKNWDKMLDSEALRAFKMDSFIGDGRVRHLEEVCEDGPQTAFRLKQMVNAYDLMIVGRRKGLKSPQTAGLSEWNEFPELGVLGDLIVSLDDNHRTSVLVIQQQR